MQEFKELNEVIAGIKDEICKGAVNSHYFQRCL